ncbi:MAG: SDR family NAD(P)-dependent oxidoreductase [Deltaproteobacteria bacterium]|nr:SDR family NAD(P)-dependent oxidoreductase [Deltaproteobacteria bacterium]
MKKAIIIGASSGIGKELTKIFASHGWEVGIAARRTDLLNELIAEIPTKIYTATIDIKNTDIAIQSLEKLIKDVGDVDIIVISSGVGHMNSLLDWSKEKETIETNVSGFTAMAGVAMHYFIKKRSGHLVGISSIASIRGDNAGPAYSASKAFMSNYLEGLRKKVTKEKIDITITDIQPGFVDTAMSKGDGLFWVASPQKAAKQIYQVIQQKKKKAYITKRWAIIAWLLKIMPDFIYDKI